MDRPVETRRLNEEFDISLNECIQLVEEYRNRSFDEDIQELRRIDGAEGLANKLRASLNDGLAGDDFDIRDEEFGSNK